MTNTLVEVRLFEPPPLILPKTYYGQTDLASILTNEEDDEKYFADLDIRKNMVLDFLQKNNKTEVKDHDAENIIKIVTNEDKTKKETEEEKEEIDEIDEFNKSCFYKFKKYLNILVETDDLDW
jgi:hypothetical protein